MAFPGTYNLNYYKGDTLEFRIYPKDASGSPYPLTDYLVTFSFSQNRGSAGTATYHEAYSSLHASEGYILCAIRPSDSSYLNAGTNYVYDVEIKKSQMPYPSVHTILTGNITVTDQVSVS
jgi:hypothetical protein